MINSTEWGSNKLGCGDLEPTIPNFFRLRNAKNSCDDYDDNGYGNNGNSDDDDVEDKNVIVDAKQTDHFLFRLNLFTIF